MHRDSNAAETRGGNSVSSQRCGMKMELLWPFVERLLLVLLFVEFIKVPPRFDELAPSRFEMPLFVRLRWKLPDAEAVEDRIAIMRVSSSSGFEIKTGT